MDSEADAKRRRLEARFGGSAGAGPSAAPLPPPREAFVAQANEALCFRLVRTAAELASAPLFHPEFTHQVFREDETVFGYRELKARPEGAPARVSRREQSAGERSRGRAAARGRGGTVRENPANARVR